MTIEPRHLAPLVDQLEFAISERKDGHVFYWFSVPPRHFKSETVKHAIVKHLKRWPEAGVAYCTHTQTFASNQSRGIRRIALRAGLKLSQDSNRQDEWELATGGGLVARGVGGELTGRGFRLIVIDDPFKGIEQAESAAEREKIWNWIENDVMTRLSPDGFLLLLHTRWHPDDAIGRAKKDERWHGQNIPALSGQNDDVALLPNVWTVDHLRGIRKANPYKFASLYQGEPRPRGGKVFHDPTWYDQRRLRDILEYLIAHGADLAYSAKSYSDKSVLVTGIRVPSQNKVYIVDGVSMRCQAHEFAKVIAERQRILPGRCRWYCSTTEKGTADLINNMEIELVTGQDEDGNKLTEKCHPKMRGMLATADKFVRAQPVANAWNQHLVLLPGPCEVLDDDGNPVFDEEGNPMFSPTPPWAEELRSETDNFTGVNDPNDDWVDALAAMYDEIAIDMPENEHPDESVGTYESPLLM